jgi:hypothetical protein
MGAMPSDCYTRDAGGSGGYGVRHHPFVYFRQGRARPQCRNDVPAAGLLASLNGPSPPRLRLLLAEHLPGRRL